MTNTSIMRLAEACEAVTAATALPLDPDTVRRHVVAGEIQGEKVGSLWLTTPKAVYDGMIAINKKTAEAAPPRTKVMDTASGTAGGYLVPGPAIPEEIAALAPYSFIVHTQIVKTKGAPAVRIPCLAAGASADPNNVIGGLAFSCLADNDQTDVQSAPAVATRSLVAQRITANITASLLLIQDSHSIHDLLNRQCLAAFSFYLDGLLLTGTGIGQPQGIINDPATLAINRAGANAIVAADVANMLGSLLTAGDLSDVFWAASPSAVKQLFKLPASELSPRSSNGNLTLAGRPVYINHYMPDCGTRGDLVLVNGRFYATLIHQKPEVKADDHVKFLSGQRVYRAGGRMNGGLMANAPFKITATTSLAVAVALDAPA